MFIISLVILLYKLHLNTILVTITGLGINVYFAVFTDIRVN